MIRLIPHELSTILQALGVCVRSDDHGGLGLYAAGQNSVRPDLLSKWWYNGYGYSDEAG